MLCLGIHIFQHVVKFHDEHIKHKKYDFSKLPPHIIVKILSQLTLRDFKNSVLVCQSWYTASMDIKITNRLCVYVSNDSEAPQFLVRPINNMLIQSTNMNKFKFRQLFRKFNYSIRDLEVRCSRLPVTRVFELFIYLTNVETFKMSSSSKDYSSSNFNAYKRIQKHRDLIICNMGKLKNLSISLRYKDLTAYIILFRYCCNIESLCWYDNDFAAYEYSEFMYNYLLNSDINASLYNITELLIHTIDRKQNSKFFEKMVQLELKQLKKLNIMEISLTYYDMIFKEFCKSYNFLEGLTINGCNEYQLIDICRYLTRLKSVELECTNANNLNELGNLKELEYLKVDRIDVVRDDALVHLFNSTLPYLQKLYFNHITATTLKMICDNYSNLVDLQLEFCNTKDCEPIYRNLFKLRKLHIGFTEAPKLHSSHFRNSDEWNITKLKELEYLIVSCCVPGITPELVQKLPNLKPEFLEMLYDPTDEEIHQYDSIAQHVEPVAANPEPVAEEFEFSDLDSLFYNDN